MLTSTNDNDLQENADLRVRLSANECELSIADAGVMGNTRQSVDEEDDIPIVSLDEGACKYVLVTAISLSNQPRTFVLSRKNYQHHVTVAMDFLPKLRSQSYRDIQIAGGGRILRDDNDMKIHIFGCSYGFGQADHELAKELVEHSVRYRGYQVTW